MVLAGKTRYGHVQERDIPGQESALFQGAVTVDGQVKLSALQAPVGCRAVAGGHRRIFEVVKSLPPLFDLRPVDVEMVLGDEHLPVIDRTGLGADVKGNPLAFKNVLIAPEIHVTLGKGLVRAAEQGHLVGLQKAAGEGDQDLSRRGEGVFILFIRDTVRFDRDRSLGDILRRRRKGGSSRQKEEQHQRSAASAPSPQHDPGTSHRARSSGILSAPPPA